MKTLITLLMLLTLTSCAEFVGQDNEVNSKYVIDQIDNPKASRMTGNGKMKISYQDYDELKLKAEESIKNEMLPENKAKEKLASIPKGGRFTMHIFRMTVDTGNTKNFTYVITKNGKEIDRVEGGKSLPGADTVPETPSHSGMDGIYWINWDYIDLKEAFTSSDILQIYAIDKILGGRDEFTIKHAPSKISAAH